MEEEIGSHRDESFEKAFDELFALAMRLAQRILGNAAAAEDVAAEALARAYADWPKVGRLPYRNAWVMRVAANLAIDAARRRLPKLEPSHSSLSIEDAVTLRMALAAALRALPRRQREVIVLRYLSGLSEEATAESLGISAGTVKSHTHRALANLRRRLSEKEVEEVIDALNE